MIISNKSDSPLTTGKANQHEFISNVFEYHEMPQLFTKFSVSEHMNLNEFFYF